VNGQVLKLPEDAPASLGDAWVLLESGDIKAAKTLFSSLVKGTSDPVKAQALFGLGKIAALDGKVIEATKNFIDSLRYNPANSDCYLALGDIYIENGGQYMPALECYGQAVAYDPESYESRQKFVNLVSALKFDKVNPNLAGIITACLEHDDLYLYFFGAPWKSVLIQDETFLTVWKFAKYQDYAKFSEEFSKAGNYGGFIHPLFLYGLGKFLVNGRDFERWIVNIRHYLLDLHRKGQYLFADSEENEYLYCALSRYAHHTDYIFSETPEEVAYIKTLGEKISGQSVFDLKELALYACYRPVYALSNAGKIFAWLGDETEHVSQILKQQIRQYREMAEIRKNIPALTLIDDEISRAVREQYEEFPYPRWSGVSNKLGEHRIESRLNDKAVKVLVAGCGNRA
jgi:tetratricopeptide (TPR) repeat protein